MPLLGKLFLYKNIMGVAVCITGIFPLLYPLLPLTLPYGKTVHSSSIMSSVGVIFTIPSL